MVEQIDGEMHWSANVDRDLLICLLEVKIVHVQRPLDSGIVDLTRLSGGRWNGSMLAMLTRQSRSGCFLIVSLTNPSIELMSPVSSL